LRFLEDRLTDLFFGVAIYHSKFRLLLHSVRELIFRNVRRQKLESREDSEYEEYGKGNRFESAFTTLCAVARLPLISAHLQH
jgi:hypothetical protein